MHDAAAQGYKVWHGGCLKFVENNRRDDSSFCISTVWSRISLNIGWVGNFLFKTVKDSLKLFLRAKFFLEGVKGTHEGNLAKICFFLCQ